jgi:hypothetical protein
MIDRIEPNPGVEGGDNNVLRDNVCRSCSRNEHIHNVCGKAARMTYVNASS